MSEMKRLLLLFVFIASLGAVDAQKMRDWFAEMPDSLLYVMTRNNRLDCIDFIENNMQARVRNRFDTFSELKTLTSDYLDLQLTENCDVQMKLLPVDDGDSSNYVCMIKTVAGPLKESHITFYESGWRQVATSKLIKIPAVGDFMVKADTVSEDKNPTKSLFDMFFITAQLFPENHQITFRLCTEGARNETGKVLFQELTYRWNGGSFEKTVQ